MVVAAAAMHQGDSPAALGFAPSALPTLDGHGWALQPLCIPPAAPCPFASNPLPFASRRSVQQLPPPKPQQPPPPRRGPYPHIATPGSCAALRGSPTTPKLSPVQWSSIPTLSLLSGRWWDVGHLPAHLPLPPSQAHSHRESTRAKVELKYFCSLIHLGVGGGMKGGEERRRGGGQRGFNRLQ